MGRRLANGSKVLQLFFERISLLIILILKITIVKKGGRNHSLFILNGMQTNTTQHRLTFFWCGPMLVGVSLHTI